MKKVKKVFVSVVVFVFLLFGYSQTKYWFGPDYATDELKNSWDFSDKSDFFDSPFITNHIDTIGISDGYLNLTTTGTDPYFFLQYSYTDNSGTILNAANFGINCPIDPSKYNYVVFKANVDTGDYFQMYWYDSNFNVGYTDFLQTQTGWHIYFLPINENNTSSQIKWSNDNNIAIRIDPTTLSNSSISFDWFKLTRILSTQKIEITPLQSGEPDTECAIIVTENGGDNATGIYEKKIYSSGETTYFYPNLLWSGSYSLDVIKYYDYALANRESAWNFISVDDVASYNSDISNATIETDGDYHYFSGNIVGNDPQIYLDGPPSYHIKTNIYKYMKIRYYLAQADNIEIIWWNEDNSYETTGNISSLAGWNVKDIDLSNFGWGSQDVIQLRVDPGQISGNSFKIDYVILSNKPLNNPVNLETDDSLIHQTVHIEDFTVASPPIIDIKAPSYTSGEDYATSIGNPWDFSDSTDVFKTWNIESVSYDAGIMVCDHNNTTGDPAVQLYVDSLNPIDPGKYHYLTIKFKEDISYDTSEDYTIMRILWGRENTFDSTSQDIAIRPDWAVYKIDLNNIQLSQGTLAWNSNTWKLFRFDPDERTVRTLDYVDYMFLTGENYTTNNLYDSKIFYQNFDSDYEPQLTVTARNNTNQYVLFSGNITSTDITDNQLTISLDFSEVPTGNYDIYYQFQYPDETKTFKAEVPIFHTQSSNPTNDPPTQPDVMPILAIRLTSPSTDPEGDSISYIINWKNNNTGEIITHNAFLNTSGILYDIMADTTKIKPGDTWTITVTPSDGVNNGPSKEITITINTGTSADNWQLFF